MRQGARIAAAIEVLDSVLLRHQPVSTALGDWGKAHRFAGSGDRNAIGGVVYDALRRKSAISWAMESEAPRALALGAAGSALGMTPEEVAASCDGANHAPEALSEIEVKGLTRPLDEAPDHVRANVPEWLWPDFVAAFGPRAIAEGDAMSLRAPADLRVNPLKASPEKVLKALQSYAAEPTPFAPQGVRVAPPSGPQRTPNLQAEAAFQAGWCEIQDEGSPIAAARTGAGPRKQILDLCAGGGGKTLAMAGAMQNTGQIYCYDDDRTRLKPIFDRVKRAGVRNVQILRAGDKAALTALGPRFDIVLVDAPCTGTGTWRRRPDAKWRLKPANLADRQKEQRQVLGDAVGLVKPGGRLVYITCSLLVQENGEQIAAFLDAHKDFRALSYADAWRENLPGDPPASADGSTDHLLLTPASHGTDGFFISVLTRAA
ncbi:MAG: RsmB/NOP family class I SAM-dependent RNA methyltransferase [Hyphomicrobium sp.]